MKKTKIIASVSPSSYKKGNLEEMIISGVDVVRLDKSYCDYDFCKSIIQEIDELNKKLNSSAAIMLDLEGPCIRTGKFSGGKAKLQTGDKIRIHMKSVTGDKTKFSINYPTLIHDLKINSIIKMNMGKIILKTIKIAENYVICQVIQGGEVESLSKIYLPEIKINRQFLTKQVKEDIIFASKNKVDYLVISNIYTEEDILEVNDLLIELNNNHISVLAKIENDIAIQNIDSIIDIIDGLILDCNTLAINMSIENIPAIKKETINKCHKKGKISITSVELESLLNNEVIPSNSEVSDLANIISLGTDAILILGELSTCVSSSVLIKKLAKIINVFEKNIDYEYFFTNTLKNETKNIIDTIVGSAILGVIELDSKAVISITNSGFAAKKISKFHPKCPIIAIVSNKEIAKSLNLYFGVVPLILSDYTLDNLLSKIIPLSKNFLELKKGDKIIIIGGHPLNKDTNFIKIEEI